MSDEHSNKLCETCSAIFLSAIPPDPDRPNLHHSEWSGLLRAAEAGCWICKRLVDRTSLANIHSRFAHVPTFVFRFSTDASFIVDFQGPATGLVSFKGVPQAFAKRAGFSIELAEGTHSSQSLERAKKWLWGCGLRHSSCLTEHQAKPPTRLIQVVREEDELKARLCDGSSFLVGKPYLTLSHRWSGNTFTTLTQENIEQWHEAIDISSLTRTFQDALFLTAELGFEYIWIDALCIIQDSDEAVDWKREAAKMGTVYQYAVCNLSAAASPDGTEGMLLAKRQGNPVPPSVNVNWDLGRASDSLILRHEPYLISEVDGWSEFRKNPLFTRAWVLQEQILAPRTLHFGPDQLYWQCASGHATELTPRLQTHFDERTVFARPSHHQSIAAPLHFSQEFQRLSELKSTHFPWFNPAETFEVHQLWLRIVENYTTRQLTFPFDRLPALNGLASEFQKLLVDEYVSGLWKTDLARGLLWKQSAPITQASPDAPEPEPPNLPSWSWAAPSVPVHWPEAIKTQCQRPEITTTLNSAFTVKKRIIRASGPLMKLRPQEFYEIPSLPYQPGAYTGSTCLTLWGSPTNSLTHEFTLCTLRERRLFHFNIDPWHFAVLQQEHATQKGLIKDTFLLPLVTFRNNSTNTFSSFGLLLRSKVDVNPKSYERLGIVRIAEGVPVMTGEVLPVNDPFMFNFGKNFSPEYYEGVDGRGNFTITLV